jgi:hypothetical protein
MIHIRYLVTHRTLAGTETSPVMSTVPVRSGCSNPFNYQLLQKLSHPLDGLLRKLPVLTDYRSTKLLDFLSDR